MNLCRYTQILQVYFENDTTLTDVPQERSIIIVEPFKVKIPPDHPLYAEGVKSIIDYKYIPIKARVIRVSIFYPYLFSTVLVDIIKPECDSHKHPSLSHTDRAWPYLDLPLLYSYYKKIWCDIKKK